MPHVRYISETAEQEEARSYIYEQILDDQKESWLKKIRRNFGYIVFGIFMLLAGIAMLQNIFAENLSQSCHCTINDHFPDQRSSSWILDTYIETDCSTAGGRDCQAICTMLALADQNPYQKGVCRVMQNTKGYLGNIYFRPCIQSIWQPLHLHMTICCKEGEAYDCKLNNKYNK